MIGAMKFQWKGALSAVLLMLATNVGMAAGANAEVMFEDRFEGRFGPGWNWLREKPGNWRIREGGLEIRIEPGMADSVVNALVRNAPDRRLGGYAVEVDVRNLTAWSEQYEQAGITWYSSGKPVLKLVKELVHGEGLIIIPGRVPMTNNMVQLRLEVSATNYVARFRPDGRGEFQLAGSGPLEPAAEEQISLQCYHGPPERAHWVRFERFRVMKLE
jgi:hypothetical protein